MSASEQNLTTDDQPEPADANRRLMLEFWEAAERKDFDAVRRLAQPDVTMEWPQSGERFRGRDNVIAAMQATDEKPEMAGEPRIVGSGDLWVAIAPLRYGEEIYQYVGVFELRDGLIQRSTELYGPPFPAPDSRAPFAER